MLTLTIVTPDKAFAPVTCDHVTFTAVDGQVGVRTGHAAMVGLLAGGFVQAKRGGKALESVAIRGGIGQVDHDQVLIISEAAVTKSRVDSAKVNARLAVIGDAPEYKTERDFLRAQLTLPATELSTDDMLSGARAAIDKVA